MQERCHSIADEQHWSYVFLALIHGNNAQLTLFEINSLWPSDTIWCYWTLSTLAEVMACCLTAPSHYLIQSWYIISEVLWHSPESSFTGNVQDISQWKVFEIYHLKFQANFSGAKELMFMIWIEIFYAVGTSWVLNNKLCILWLKDKSFTWEVWDSDCILWKSGMLL